MIVPLAYAIGMIAPLLILTTSPVGTDPGDALSIIAIYLAGFAIPAVESIPAVSRVVPGWGAPALAGLATLLAVLWMSYVAWALRLGVGSDGIPVLGSTAGYLGVLALSTVSIWSVVLSALVMVIRRRPRLRATLFAASGGLGLAIVVASLTTTAI